MLSHNSSHIQFITYTQFHDSNITIYPANLVNLIQNTNKLYKNVSHNIESKTPQTISHNHIKIIGQKYENTKSTQFYEPIRIKAPIGPSNTTIS